MTLNALANDTDPDGDPLTVAAAPTLVSPEGVDPSTYSVSLSEDGQFFFVAGLAGAVPVPLRDHRRQRERLGNHPRRRRPRPRDNRPPIAVRDDVTISRGGTRIVYVMQNDSDPDGDVIALTGFAGAPGVSVDEVGGVGLRITVAPDAPSRVELRTTRSPTGAPIRWTARSSSRSATSPSVDQAPVAKPDVVEVRAGRTVMVPVLLNDYDPEGEAIHVANVATSPSATARIGPGGQEVYVSVDPDGDDRLLLRLRRRRHGRQPHRLVRPGAPRPAGPGQPAARSPAPTSPAPAPATASRSACWPTTPTPTATRSASTRSPPSRRSATATVNPDGTITYASAGGFSGTDTFRYVVVDAKGDRAIGEVLVGVLPNTTGNTPPTASDDAYTVVAGSDTVALDVLTNDSDADGDALHISHAAGNEPAPLDADRTHVMFTPPATITGDTERLDVELHRSTTATGAPTTRSITVDVVATRAPVAPVAVDDVVGPVLPGTALSIDVLANDLDPDGSRADLDTVEHRPGVDVRRRRQGDAHRRRRPARSTPTPSPTRTG